MRLRRPLAVVLLWGVTVGGVLAGVRATVVLPERCPAVTEDEARAAATEAIAWFGRNQASDGRWAYRYDRSTNTVDRRDHAVRHSGVTLSLAQAHAAGFPDALALADAGVVWSLGRLVRRGDWAAVRAGDGAPTGATALLVAALATRREATGDARWDDEMVELGRFLVAMTEPSGAVLARWDAATEAPVPGEHSVFFTGEAYFALGLLDRVDPDGGWRPTADRIGRYLATERDDAEDRWPATPDHWAAYGLDVATTSAPLDADGRAYVRELAAAFGIQVRWESQRTGSGLNRWVLRGVPGLGAAVGTLGEGLGGLWRGSEAEPGLGDERTAIGDRLRCVAGMLVDRQASAAEAGGSARPGLVRGAWFRLDVTQMDDQQHALSGLLAALPALAEGGPVTSTGTGDAPVGRLLWLVAVAVAVANPPRLRQVLAPGGRGGTGQTAGAVLGAVGVAAALLVALAAAAGPLARAADVSGTTALVAAGIVVGVTAGIDVGRRPAPLLHRRPVGRGGPVVTGGRAEPVVGEDLPAAWVVAVLGGLAVCRPAVVLMVLAVGADLGAPGGVAVALGAAAAGLAPLVRAPAWWPTDDATRTAVAIVALVGAVDLILHGILSI